MKLNKKGMVVDLRFAERSFPISASMNQILRVLQYQDETGEWHDVPMVTIQEQYEQEQK